MKKLFHDSEKKQIPASSQIQRLIKVLISIAVLAVGFFAVFTIDNTYTIKIRDQDTDQVYYSTTVEVHSMLTYGWIHPFEYIPWTEEYLIMDDNKLLLKKITVAGFGAGIPHNKGKVTRMENGLIIMDEIDQQFSEINWIHSQTATEYIMLNGEKILRGGDLPHHGSLNLRIEKRLKICLR